MKKLVVGSTALKFHYPLFDREPKDIDYFVTEPMPHSTSGGKRIENLYHPLIAEFLKEKGGTEISVATPDELYTIKVSHAFWVLKNQTWGKHMFDMCFLKREGAVLIPEFYDVLYQTWEEIHGKKRANLNVPASEFFTGSVKRIYDHDSIHDSVAYGDRPLFEKILKDNSEVAVSRDKFEALSHEEKCNLLREEVYATALERIVIPSDYTASPKGAYGWALRQTITSFSKGWFPLWVVLNYEELRLPDVDYVQRHKDNADRLILLEAS